jgi:hypothetical protein
MDPQFSCQPKDDLTGAGRGALRSLTAYEALTVIAADKSNDVVVLATTDCKQKIAVSSRS